MNDSTTITQAPSQGAPPPPQPETEHSGNTVSQGLGPNTIAPTPSSGGQACPFCTGSVETDDPLCPHCGECLVESYIKQTIAEIDSAIETLKKPTPAVDGVRTFARDAVISGLAGVALPVSQTTALEKSKTKEAILGELVSLRERFAQVLSKAADSSFVWTQVLDVERLKKMWPPESRRDFLAWSCPSCRAPAQGESLDIWIVHPFAEIAEKHRCPLCKTQSACPSLRPTGALGSFERKQDRETFLCPPKLNREFLPSVTSTRPIFTAAVLIWCAAFLNGIFAGFLGTISSAFITASLSPFGAINSLHLGLLTLVLWVGYGFVYIMILAFGAALVIPCFMITEVFSSKKLPTRDIALGMLLAFTLGGVLSSYLETVIPGGWFTSLASSARQNPWTYVLPVILLIGVLGAGIERMADAMPFCRKCKKWFSVLPNEWIIPPDVMLTKDAKAFSGDESFWSKITKFGGPAPTDGMTIHRGTSHCQSIRLALCPDCNRGIAHVAEVKPTLYFGNQGASVGIVQRDVGYVSVPERIVKDMGSNKSVDAYVSPGADAA